MAYATVADVSALCVTPLTTDQQDRASQMLTQAAARIDAYCRRTFASAQSTIVLRALGSIVVLPRTPVISVDTVKLVDYLGHRWPVPIFGFDGIDRLDLSYYGGVINLPAIMFDSTWTGTVEVTYTAGYLAPPPEVASLNAELVARIFNSPTQGVTGIKTQGAGPYTMTIDSSGAGGGLIALTDDDKAVLKKFRRLPQAVELR